MALVYPATNLPRFIRMDAMDDNRFSEFKLAGAQHRDVTCTKYLTLAVCGEHSNLAIASQTSNKHLYRSETSIFHRRTQNNNR